MNPSTAKIGKLSQAARTVLGTSFQTWRMARGACRNGANQKWSELSRLLHLLRSQRLNAILEIGVDRGGTMAVWSRLASPDAHLIGLDLAISPAAKTRIEAQLSPRQTLILIEGDSHAATAKQQVFAAAPHRPLDFLFIDGDHSYDGAKQDFVNYSPLVRKHGIIAFHDIIPDYGSRFGMNSHHDSGGVYKFWREVSGSFKSCAFVEDGAQNGYGIGVIYV